MAAATPVLIVAAGSAFDIDLGAAGSTGYTWKLDPVPEAIELLGQDYLEAPGAQIGDAGRMVFHLRATRAGRLALRFVLKRAWESQPIGEKTFDVEVREA